MDDVELVARALGHKDLTTACPIGISPEASIYCSAGYCGVCLRRRIEGAIAALQAAGWQKVGPDQVVAYAEDVKCPRPANSSPENTTAIQCIKAGDCGCLYASQAKDKADE